MIQNGSKPIAPNPKQRSFPKTFGLVSSGLLLPEEFDADAHLEQPDQNADGLPMGCTDYCVRELATSEELILFLKGFNYDQSRAFEGKAGRNEGVDIRDAFKCSTVYGLQNRTDPTDNPLNYRRAPYYEVHPDGGLDYFDAIRSAMLIASQKDGKKHAVGVGTFWLSIWEQTQKGIVPSVYTYDKVPEHYPWHAWAFVGWKIIEGEICLVAKSWQGISFGDMGYSYYNREVVNKVFNEWGTIALMQIKTTDEDVQKVKLTIIEFALHYILKMFALGGYKEAFPSLIKILRYLRL